MGPNSRDLLFSRRAFRANPLPDRVPDQRWREIAAVPLRVELGGYPALTVGAVSAAIARNVSVEEKTRWGEIMVDELAPIWQEYLTGLSGLGTEAR